jgi:voltage-gated potassium channel
MPGWGRGVRENLTAMTTLSPVVRAAVASTGRCAVMVVVLGVCFALLPLRGARSWMGVVVGGVVLAAIVPLAVRRLRRVLASDRPVLEAVEAVVLLLAMLITGFAAMYYAMNDGGDQFAGLGTRIDAIYFTTSTLSTVGFGDVHATGQAARLAVTVQILFDLAFIGIAARALLTVAQHRAGERQGLLRKP